MPRLANFVSKLPWSCDFTDYILPDFIRKLCIILQDERLCLPPPHKIFTMDLMHYVLFLFFIQMNDASFTHVFKGVPLDSLSAD